MELLHWFAAHRTPFLDGFFTAVTYLGGEMAVLAVALIVYFCVDKKRAYALFLVGIGGTVTNQFFKFLFRIPRPYVRDPSLVPVPAAMDTVDPYSFPSGHTQTAVGLYGMLLRFVRQPFLRAFCWAAVVLVPLSRMYLGVHTPADVLFSAGLALLFVHLLPPLLDACYGHARRMTALFSAQAAAAALSLLYMYLSGGTADAMKNGYTLLGVSLGLLAAYLADAHFVYFSTRAPLIGQVVKVAGGVLLAFGCRAVLRAPFAALFGPAESLFRYFLLVFLVGGVYPLAFPLLARLGAGREKNT